MIHHRELYSYPGVRCQALELKVLANNLELKCLAPFGLGRFPCDMLLLDRCNDEKVCYSNRQGDQDGQDGQEKVST